VRLAKVPTTGAEFMMARTMQPDFGGLLEPIQPHEGPPSVRAALLALPEMAMPSAAKQVSPRR
jgi:hypothetical protein